MVIIPAFNEENAIGQVLKDIPSEIVDEVVVVDNNSSDRTTSVAEKYHATVLSEERKGYGYACLRGIGYARTRANRPDILVFIDADYSDYPEEIEKVIQPIEDDEADLVIGSRALGDRQKGAMLPQQIFGNWLATRLLRILYGARFTDLGPFRAIKLDKLLSINMQDKTYGWTVEMQLKAVKNGLRCCEVPVSYRPRIGKSKITGTVSGTIGAGWKIISTIFRHL